MHAEELIDEEGDEDRTGAYPYEVEYGGGVNGKVSEWGGSVYARKGGYAYWMNAWEVTATSDWASAHIWLILSVFKAGDIRQLERYERLEGDEWRGTRKARIGGGLNRLGTAESAPTLLFSLGERDVRSR